MTPIQQYNNYSCLGACLQSIKTDFGDTAFDHRSFIQSNLDLFNGGTEIEGSCSISSIAEVCARCGLTIEMITAGSLACDSRNEAVVAYVNWNGEEGQKHFVRLGEVSEGVAQVMNPQGAVIQNMPIKWIQSVYLIKVK